MQTIRPGAAEWPAALRIGLGPWRPEGRSLGGAVGVFS